MKKLPFFERDFLGKAIHPADFIMYADILLHTPKPSGKHLLVKRRLILPHDLPDLGFGEPFLHERVGKEHHPGRVHGHRGEAVRV